MGISQSICLATSLNMVGEMIGSKGSKGAIVYGIYSLFDKIINGIIIFVVMVIIIFICSYLNRTLKCLELKTPRF